MDDHVSEAIARPDLIDLGEGLLCLRFESMKVASALAAVRHLLDTGVVRPGDTLLDSSSGIYAYGLALAAPPTPARASRPRAGCARCAQRPQTC